MKYAVMDVETTGFACWTTDRIVEIAIIRLDDHGELVDEWSTLLHPDRDLGPTHVHGITGADVENAPRFREVASDILDRLSGATLIAHNAHFDHRFVAAELFRLGYSMPSNRLICTLSLSRQADPNAPCRKLSSLCEHFQVPNSGQHHALADARASYGLLQRCLQRLNTESLDAIEPTIARIARQPSSLISPLLRGRPPVTRKSLQAAAASAPSLLNRLIEKLPRGGATHPDMDPYLELLDRTLQDRWLTREEQDSLVEAAQSLGFSGSTVVAAHRRYISDLIATAFADGVLSEFERIDLNHVRKLLGVSDADFSTLLNSQNQSRFSGTKHSRGLDSELRGKSVCFTGTLVATMKGQRITREQAGNFARSAGLIVKDGVSHELDYLVVADPTTLSGKAVKARSIGTTILAEGVLWSMLGIAID